MKINHLGITLHDNGIITTQQVLQVICEGRKMRKCNKFLERERTNNEYVTANLDL